MIVKRDVIARQGVHIQAPMFDLFKSVKEAFLVTEQESHFLQTKVWPYLNNNKIIGAKSVC
jgi:hypothetical protein